MATKPGRAAHGGHGWFVTFADLMALLVAFFVMLSAFSTQDSQKLQVVAGSMRDAFGVQNTVRYSGIVEVAGLPTRTKLKNAAHIPPEEASSNPSDDERSRRRQGARLKHDHSVALAAASLRQAMQDLPEIAELSKHVMMEETRDGLNVEIIDNDPQSMFADGSKEPNERTRRLIQKLAGPLKSANYRLTIVGHTGASSTPLKPDYGPWELSADRANAVRRILEQEGVPTASFFGVTGKADIQPLFPDDPFISANRRVTITLVREQPSMPIDFEP
jgi:chemotaxis protein MotB